MSEFKKGQLVAAKDEEDESWALVKYDHKAGHRHVVKRIAGAILVAPEDRYKTCLPAEEVWPEIFIGWERRAGEQAAEAVAKESALVQRLRRQIGWLCQELTHADMCPSVSAIASCDKNCPRCWEQASLEAVENADGA